MKRILVTLLFVLLSLSMANSQMPRIISYQGYLADVTGKPIADGAQNLTFKLFDNMFTSTPIWSETIEVTTQGGLFDCYLGITQTLDSLKFDKQYYISVSVGSVEFSSRRKLSAVPYSIAAQRIVAPNAKEGYVLTFSDSVSKWMPGGAMSYPYSADVSTSGNAFSLKQTGAGAAMTLIKYSEIGKAVTSSEKNDGDVGLKVSYNNIAQFCGTNGIVSEINSANSVAGAFSIFNAETTRPPLYAYTEGKCGVALFQAGNAEGTVAALKIDNISKGNCIYIDNKNTLCDEPAIQIWNESKGTSLNIFNNTAGTAGSFYIAGDKSSDDVLIAGTMGLGRAGYFYTINSNTTASTLAAENIGKGVAVSGYTESPNNPASQFIVHNTENIHAAVAATTNGATGSTAIYGKSNGKSRAGSFESNATATEPTVYISSLASTPALNAVTKGSGTAALFSDETGSSHISGVMYVQSKLGKIAANFVSTDAETLPAVRISKGTSSSSIALEVNGSVDVTGTVNSAKLISMIDNPIDPENKYLNHSYVESSEMKNIYDGIAVLDDRGEAVVTLPDWFSAYNKDVRYQLTCIGGWAQVYIAEKVNGNKFKIAGGSQGMEISWQVTGVRNDRFAKAYPMEAVTDKSADEIGKYLNPELYGIGKEKAIRTQGAESTLQTTAENLNLNVDYVPSVNNQNDKAQKIKNKNLQQSEPAVTGGIRADNK